MVRRAPFGAAHREIVLFVIASEREAIQLEIRDEAQWSRRTSTVTISWIASLTLTMKDQVIATPYSRIFLI